jgi:hypothetical protein
MFVYITVTNVNEAPTDNISATSTQVKLQRIKQLVKRIGSSDNETKRVKKSRMYKMQ